MSKFKVGDIVRRITDANTWEHGGVSYILPVGTVCRVTHVKGPWIMTPTETWPSYNGEGEELLSFEDNFELVDIPKPQPEVAEPFNYLYGQSSGAKREAARAIAGGLQQHSVGDAYPLCPVAVANGDAVHWEVHNLQDGTVMCELTSGLPLIYDTATGVVDRIHALLTGRLCEGHVWLSRPPCRPRESELTPREAYQAAMEKEADHV